MHTTPSAPRLIAGLPFLLLLSTAAVGQATGAAAESPALVPYEYAGHFRLIAATGEIIPEPLDGGPSAPLECGDFIMNALTNLDASTAYLSGFTVPTDREYIDWGVVSVDSTSDIVTEFRIGYATFDLDPSLGGPGAALDFSFYLGYEGPCAPGDTAVVDELARFEFTGLPGYDGLGTPRGYFMTVDLRGGLEFELPEGPFGLGQRFTPSQVLRDTGMIQSLAGSPLGDQFNPDGNGQVTALDIFEPDAATGTCLGSGPVGFDFDTGLNVGSHYLLLRKVNAEAASPASAAVRNDPANLNPIALLPAGTPILGENFTFLAASTGPAERGVFLFAFGAPATVPTAIGTLLVDATDPGGELLGTVGLVGPHFYAGGFAIASTPLPPNVDLCGQDVFVQAAQFGSGLRLTNAVDLRLGVY